ncbi:MAG: hypothetical protein V2I97_02195 [Desulfococcaceae bacterium]|jgi:hypothetical protein|nr:hypothetical protein [Desulfococcaceae bacterium]
MVTYHHKNILDGEIPGGIYLCQVGENVSCGACCGLYNVADPSREALAEMLTLRTRAFAEVPRTVEGILSFKDETEHRECQIRPYPEFHHCPYIGLIGDSLSRAGCLLHPLGKGNRGVDFRGLSYYGGMACRTYFCPACKELPPLYKKLIRALAGDWYLYGLIVTEKQLLTAFFGEMEIRLGRTLCEGDFENIMGNPAKVRCMRTFLQYRIQRPAAGSEPLCNYFFEDGLYGRKNTDDTGAGGKKSRYFRIFRELAWEFETADALREAEKNLDEILECLTR